VNFEPDVLKIGWHLFILTSGPTASSNVHYILPNNSSINFAHLGSCPHHSQGIRSVTLGKLEKLLKSCKWSMSIHSVFNVCQIAAKPFISQQFQLRQESLFAIRILGLLSKKAIVKIHFCSIFVNQ
jgi:hypothetical protein